MMHGPIYTFLYWVVRFGLFLYHPIFKVVGRKRVPKTGRVLFCCNHSGLADPVWLVMALYKDHMPRIMAKKEAMAVPVLGWFFRRSGYIPVDRKRTIGDFGALKEVVHYLEQGESVVMFPEGTRSRTGKPQKPKSGIGFLVYKTGAPVLPVKIEGTFGWPWVRRIRVKFGQVMHLEKDPALEPKAQYKQFANQIMDAINFINI